MEAPPTKTKPPARQVRARRTRGAAGASLAAYSGRVLGLAVAAALLAPTAACPPGPTVPVPPATTQLITVVVPTTASTRAALRLWRRVDGCWRPVAGAWSARVGRTGISANRREGDGTTPAGVFAV